MIICVDHHIGKFQKFYGTQLCKAEGCFERAGKVSGYCPKHISIILHGHKSRFNGTRLCLVSDCTKKVYSRNLCHTHYELNRRNGSVIYKRNIFQKCLVKGCENQITIISKSGLCNFHLIRQENNIDLLRPWGNKGSNNPNWKGGVADYPNHSEMKRVRLQVLKEANYICQYCGKPTKEIHHKDYSKSNHSKNNLIAACHSCNSKMRDPSKKQKSKYRKFYGYTLKELAEMRRILRKLRSDQKKAQRLPLNRHKTPQQDFTLETQCRTV